MIYIYLYIYIYIWSSFSFVTKNMTHFWTSGEPPTEIIHGVVLQHLRNGSTNPNISQCSVSSIPDFRVVFSFVFDDLNYCSWCFENSAAPPCRPKLTYSNLLSFIYFGSLGIATCHVGLSLNLPFCSWLHITADFWLHCSFVACFFLMHEGKPSIHQKYQQTSGKNVNADES